MAEPPESADSKSQATSSMQAPSGQKPLDTAVEEDSDPDFDDLDDVLDQFSAATSQQQQSKSQPPEPAPSSSGPGRPLTEKSSALPPDLPIPSGPHASETEDEFMARLTAEMSDVMSKMSLDPAASAATPEEISKMGQELEEFTQKMEAEGIKPEDLLRAILGEDVGGKVGDMAHAEATRRESDSKSKSKSKSRSPQASRDTAASAPSAAAPSSAAAATQPSTAKQPSTSFEDTIRKTMARMESSSAAASSATAKTSQQKSEEDMLAEMLRALEAESGSQSDSELSKMFLGMMEQLTNKDMLYEPMRELSQKFPDYLSTHQPPALPQSEHERFSRQAAIVRDIVAKFEEPGYSDDDPKCREFIWEKMQEMQTEGSPPDDLIANPLPGMSGWLGGGGGEGAEGLDESCPTQ
ncbi:uncharacterized protein Z520_12388 [Fonsecaea multimorphosa CBS 102226]|uniref:Peroxin-19 n=1 Tax=Fonsecaea multimorphosa CBS 102226 TaxID=1442371 RepID=A0A0D2JN47_9EURO|nr:uncharacterized protein Z520_12388 [Fonsecaea multimorphosa CBS 102226]KIX91899.1 hypothetical protein Z520_12388 [Fonsecaea multimorphosa CBS 102226]OAL17221.1 hypothetical protein AYO22_11786 [Fonsecaea multimorphosa]